MKNYKNWVSLYISEKPVFFQHQRMEIISYWEKAFEHKLFCEKYLKTNFPNRKLMKDYNNLDSICCFLVREADKCENFKIDIATDISVIDEYEDNKYMREYTMYFGFRDNGVDHIDFVYSRLCDSGDKIYGESPYFSLYCLERNKDNDSWKLYGVKYN